MPQLYEEKYPNNGMNKDDDARFLEQSESRFILNCRAGTSENENVGAIENIKGTTEVDINLPSGRNVCIGSYGDQTTHSNFFFVWNENSEHSIYRYLPEDREVRLMIRGQILNFKEFDLINDINVVGENLLYRDLTNPPRSFNFLKTDTDNEDFRQTFNWYLGDEYLKIPALKLTFEVRAYDKKGGTLIWSDSFQPYAVGFTKKEKAAAMASSLNQGVDSTPPNGLPITTFTPKATACGEFVEMEMEDGNFYEVVAFEQTDPLNLLARIYNNQIIPQNHYQEINGRILDVIKYPPAFPVEAIVSTNYDFNRNYISEEVFQFAIRYTYQENNKSTISPYSNITYNKSHCNGEKAGNYIEIGFSVLEELDSYIDIQSIKTIELFVKKGSFGKWQIVESLEQESFVDIKNTHFDFYNDGIYDVVDQDRFVVPSYNVPIRTKNQEVVKNRLFYANNLENYDNVCVDADLDLTYDNSGGSKGKTIKGRIYISNIFRGGNQAIIGNTSTSGGMISINFTGAEDENPIQPLPNSSSFGSVNYHANGQNIDSGIGGFIVYLAGTSYKTISKQHQEPEDNGYAFGTDPSTGIVYEGSGYFRLNNVVYSETHPSTKNKWGKFQHGFYSTFEINGVPDGTYSLRVAGHETTRAEYNDLSFAYQKTSTFTTGITNLQKSPSDKSKYHGDYEVMIEVKDGEILDEIKIEIADLTHIVTHNFVKQETSGTGNIGAPTYHHSYYSDTATVIGYLVDNDSSTPLNNATQFLTELRIGNAVTSGIYSDISDIRKRPKTDHNGFFFNTTHRGLGLNMHIDNISPLTNSSKNYINEYYHRTVHVTHSSISENVPASSFSHDSPLLSNIVEPFIVRSKKGTSDGERIKIKGITESNGVPVNILPIISSRATTHKSDGFGNYEFWHYGIETTALIETLIFGLDKAASCGEDYGFTEYELLLSQAYGVPPTIIHDIITATSFINSLKSNFKRGWDGSFGIKYYDEGMRSTFVNTSNDLKLHIPFYSEKDENGIIQDGKPIVNWEINHTPPKWAKTWQWVRTKNISSASYLQWSILEARYQDENGNLSSVATAVKVALDITNLTAYKKQYLGSNLSIDITTETTRVRFIKDKNEDTYQEYLDLKVLAYDPVGIITVEKSLALPPIEEGTLIEIYNEKLEVENNVYYEIGEVFGFHEINGKKYHKGLTQDQTDTTPAKGIIRSGDSYYSKRDIYTAPNNKLPLVSSPSISEFYESKIQDIGRPDAINPDAYQIWSKESVRHSGLLIPSSNVNELNRFLPDDSLNLPKEYGEINKIILSSNVLMSIHEFRWVSNYIGEAVMRKQAGSNELVASTNVFGDFRAAKLITGTINQESVSEYKGNIYAYDLNKGIVTRWAADGLSSLSEYKMSDFFLDKSKLLLNNMEKAHNPIRVLGKYDSKHNEYLLSFNELVIADTKGVVKEKNMIISTTQIIDGISFVNDNSYIITNTNSTNSVLKLLAPDTAIQKNTTGVDIINHANSQGTLTILMKNDLTNDPYIQLITLQPGQGIVDLNFETRSYSIYTPPVLTSLLQAETLSFSEKLKKWITFYSFKPEMFGDIDLELLGFNNGKLWIHNDSDIRNNFYGVQYTSQVDVLFNQEPAQVKVYQAIGVESYFKWGVLKAKTKNGMKTFMPEARFVRKEDSYFSEVMRDINDPSNITDKILNGRQLRDRTISVLIENKDTLEVVLYSVNMLSTISTRHRK